MNTCGLHDGFVAALVDPGLPTPALVAASPGASRERRFGVYRNNVLVSLVSALEAKYPVVRELVGPEFFGACAATFVRRTPPRTPVLAEYGDTFALFLEGFEPAARLPYLPDVARLEAAWLRAYHAADALALPAASFSEIDPSDLADLRFGLHPSATVLASRFAIGSLWAAHRGALAIEDVDPFMPEDVLIIRPGLDVNILHLPSGCAVLLQTLSLGLDLGRAVEDAMAARPDFDLTECLRILTSSGIAIQIHDRRGA
jgi:hypothetical protein